jgi:hypothetical protein
VKRVVLTALAAAAFAAGPGQAAAAQCGLPDGRPLWIDHVSLRTADVFTRPGVIAAASTGEFPARLRAQGVKTVYMDLNFNRRVGTTVAPADPAGIDDKARRLYEFAAQQMGCPDPVIALNELFGAQTTTPWSAANAQYRANVLALMRGLAARGAKPTLFIPNRPYTGDEAGDWWREAARYGEIVREVHFSAPILYRMGPVAANRFMRIAMRRGISELLAIGIPPSRLGILLGFQTGGGILGGRSGLQPAHKWFEVIKWNVLAARQVVSELPVATIWSWGWPDYGRVEDPDKERSACVYLWTRTPRFCDGPSVAGPEFNSSLTEGQISSLPARAKCSLNGRLIGTRALGALSSFTGDRQVAFTALFARVVESTHARVTMREILAAERALVALRFGGSFGAYRSALARSRATLAVGRGVIADELRRAIIKRRLRVVGPSATQISAYYSSYANISTRLVQVTPAPWWLGGKRRGVALATIAPAPVFKVPVGKRSVVVSLEGERYRVRPLAQPRPLGALPPEQARPAIRAALVEFARTDAYHSWAADRQEYAQRFLICKRDELPLAAEVELATYAPFLAVSATMPPSQRARETRRP